MTPIRSGPGTTVRDRRPRRSVFCSLLLFAAALSFTSCAGVRAPQGPPADFRELGLFGSWDFDMTAPLPQFGELVFGALGRVTARCESSPELTRTMFEARLRPGGVVRVVACGATLWVPTPVRGDTVAVQVSYRETEEQLERQCLDPDVHPRNCTRFTMVAVPRRVPREATIHITRRLTARGGGPRLIPPAWSRSPALRTWRRDR